MIDNPIDIILKCIVLFLVAWVALAISLNIRDARKSKHIRRAWQQDKASETVPIEQVMYMAEWKMEQWMTERESN